MRQGLLVLLPGIATLAVSLFATPLRAAPPQRQALDPEGIARLRAATGNSVNVRLDRVTGAARFVRLGRGPAVDLAARAAKAHPHAKSMAFFADYGTIFGIRNSRTELEFAVTMTDQTGATHVSHRQVYRGVPVFGAVLRSHFDRNEQLRSVGGVFVAGISLDTTPTRSQAEAEQAAVHHVAAQLEREPAAALTARPATLSVFRKGLAQGVDGPNLLVYHVEVGNGLDVREFVFVDAHTGKVVAQFTGVHDQIHRKAFDGQGDPDEPGPNYPATPFWVEGDPFPTGTTEADNMIYASGDIWDIGMNGFGYTPPFPNTGGEMHAIFNRGWGCPNASWQGTYISFCPGFTTDDVTVHEWAHAYTDFTHNLIYAWQSGALNESYSDIWGEVADLINGRGTDAPGGARTDGACSTLGGSPPPTFTVNSPPDIAGDYPVQGAAFNPSGPLTVTDDLVLVDDAVGATSDGCEPFANAAAVSGNIALIDRGGCFFVDKTNNAIAAGATGVVVANDRPGLINMGGAGPLTIPSVLILQTDGDTIKDNLPGVNATITLGVSTDNSYRWLMGDDQGGVHSNSGIPNHAFALLADGGTYNGQTITGIGLNKALAIYWQAQSAYQVPYSNFADHAEALEASCDDLTGTLVNDLWTGAPDAEITSDDCDQVAAAMLAVEMRTPPTQCGFEPLLAKDPPAACGIGTSRASVFNDDFEDGAPGWTLDNEGVYPTYTPRDWELTTGTLDGRTGTWFFGADDPAVGDCNPESDDQSGVMYLMSPIITARPDPFLTFDHYVATEIHGPTGWGWDGGVLQISVNGGDWTDVAAADFTYNPYNTFLVFAPFNTNPLAYDVPDLRPAYCGTDEGSNSGSWGQSQVDLQAYATEGDTVQLRYALGADGCGGVIGWFVDNVNVCAADSDNDGVPDDQDVCPGTVIPEAVPTVRLGVNRWALVDGDDVFDTTSSRGRGPGLSFTTEDTLGCPCEQIIEAQGLGKGHTKFGCSNGAMLNWVKQVTP
jgi:Zn-dependent metalloprotease